MSAQAKADARTILIDACVYDHQATMRDDPEYRDNVSRYGFGGFANMSDAELVQATYEADLAERDARVMDACIALSDFKPGSDKAIEHDLTHVWTNEHDRLAQMEGWCLSHSAGSRYGPLQIQRIDSQDMEGVPQLLLDDEAWVIVRKRALPHHVLALNLVLKHNPDEVTNIQKVWDDEAYR